MDKCIRDGLTDRQPTVIFITMRPQRRLCTQEVPHLTSRNINIHFSKTNPSKTINFFETRIKAFVMVSPVYSPRQFLPNSVRPGVTEQIRGAGVPSRPRNRQTWCRSASYARCSNRLAGSCRRVTKAPTQSRTRADTAAVCPCRAVTARPTSCTDRSNVFLAFSCRGSKVAGGGGSSKGRGLISARNNRY